MKIEAVVRGIIILEDKLLIFKLKPEHDFWCLPDGRVELGETLLSAIHRGVLPRRF